MTVVRYRRILALLLLAASTLGLVLLGGIPVFAQTQQAVRTNSGFLANRLPANDDESSDTSVSIGFSINFFGVSYNTLFVNNNGNVTFADPLPDFTPEGLTGSSLPIIAPFWADVDTRGTASSLVTYGRDTVNGRAAFGVNWVNVGYFNTKTDKLNSFQLVMIDRSDTGAGNFDIEFNYNRILWETGDLSGGTNGLGGSSASVGYSNGSTLPGTFLEIAGSLVPGSFLDSNSNGLVRRTQPAGGILGRLLFAVRSGIPDPAVSTISPNLIAPGSPQFQIQVNGSNFVTGSTVQWILGPTTSLATTFQSAGVLLATVPATLVANPGTAQVRVVNPVAGSNPSPSVPFTITAPQGPVVTGITPTFGVQGATVSATVSGSNLTGATTVAFTGGSGISATIGSGGTATSLPITITIAAGAPTGARTFTVTTPAGTSQTFNFTINPAPPSVTGIDPTSAVPGTTVSATVSGSNLTGASAVSFIGGSGISATIGSGGIATSLPITITVAAGAPIGARSFTVTTPGGTSQAFNFTINPAGTPTITLTGLTPTPFPTQSATVGVSLSSAATASLTGTLTLTFQPNAGAVSTGYVDPAMQFASGGRSVDFTVPAGTTTATLPQNGLIQQGTVAGTITVSLTALSLGGTNVLPQNPPTRSLVVAGLPPVMYANSLQVTQKTSTSFNVEFNAYSTTRDLISVTFAFGAASDAVLNGTTSFTVRLDSIAPQWFSSATGLSSGAAFHLSTPFTITGDSSAIGTVSVTLTNSVGNSSTQTVSF